MTKFSFEILSKKQFFFTIVYYFGASLMKVKILIFKTNRIQDDVLFLFEKANKKLRKKIFENNNKFVKILEFERIKYNYSRILLLEKSV